MLAKKFALGFGIAVIFPMMVHYGVSSFVSEPKWKDYYSSSCNLGDTKNQAQQAQWQQKQAGYGVAQKNFQRALFSIAAPVGILTIILGSMVTIQAVGTGLMFGGIFSVLDGYFNYWYELPDKARFISLLIAFGVLLWVGFRRLAK